MSEVDFLIFPIRNEQGLKVNSWESYWHMINTIVGAQVELAEDYPDQKLLVCYEVDGA